MKKNSFFMVMVCLFIMLPFQIWAGGGAAQSNNAKKGDITMDILWFGPPLEIQGIKTVLDAYKKENPNISFNVIETVYDDSNAKIQTMIAGGTPPDISRVSDVQTGRYKPYALDLVPYIGDINTFKAQYMDILDATLFTDGNKITAVPLDITHDGVVVNKTLFDKAGVPYPTDSSKIWTWDEFRNAVRTVMQKTGCRYGIVWDVSVHRWAGSLYQFGGAIYSPDRKTSIIDNADGIRAIQNYVDLHKEGLMPTSVWVGNTKADDLWYSGEVAVRYCGSWAINNYKGNTNFEWTIAYNPIEKQRSTVIGGHYRMGFAKSKNPQEAGKLLNFMHTKPIDNLYCKSIYSMSYRKDSADLGWDYGREQFAIARNELENSAPASFNDWMFADVTPILMTEMRPVLQSAISEKISVREAATQLKKIAEDALLTLKK